MVAIVCGIIIVAIASGIKQWSVRVNLAVHNQYGLVSGKARFAYNIHRYEFKMWFHASPSRRLLLL